MTGSGDGIRVYLDQDIFQLGDLSSSQEPELLLLLFDICHAYCKVHGSLLSSSILFFGPG